MNTHTAYTGKRDPINCPANQPDPTRDYHDVPFPEGTQPKPTTTGSIANPSTRVTYCDKPATGEWTVEAIAVIRGRDGDFGLAAAINAALAAEKEKVQTLVETLKESTGVLQIIYDHDLSPTIGGVIERNSAALAKVIPEYKEFLYECAKHCRCSMTICESVMRGAPCEERIEPDDLDDNLP